MLNIMSSLTISDENYVPEVEKKIPPKMLLFYRSCMNGHNFTCQIWFTSTVEPRYNEVLGTMKITLLYQVSHYIRVQKQRNIKSWDQQNYLVIRGFCYIRPLYNEVPLYMKYVEKFNFYVVWI